MIALTRIYTRTGDKGMTALGSGERVSKTHLRIEAFGTVDELNAALGIARLYTAAPEFAELDAMLARIQNELFDVGADLCLPDKGKGRKGKNPAPLRILPSQVARLEREIDEMNSNLPPLRSFVLPGGHSAAAYLHLCRTICRRAERLVVALSNRRGEPVNTAVVQYMNRLSDHFFVASRWVNAKTVKDVLWSPGLTQNS
jgi:cob(I)alamin adenosyltransferase